MRSSNACASRRREVPARWKGRRVGAVLGVVVTALLCGGANGSPPDAQTAPTTFEALLELYAAMPGLEASFVEEKALALLIEPLRSRGRLYFDPPDTLLRRVEAPRSSEILVTGNTVRIREGGVEQQIDLESRPEARPLVESMLWLFAGNRAALEEVYAIDYRVESQAPEAAETSRDAGAAWTLELEPRSPPLDLLIRSLRVHGEGRATRSLELLETSGDRTSTRIVEADPARRFAPEERSRLFGRDGSDGS